MSYLHTQKASFHLESFNCKGKPVLFTSHPITRGCMHSGCDQQRNTTSVAFNSQLCWLCLATRHKLDPTQCLTSITDVQIHTQGYHSCSVGPLRPNVSQAQYAKISRAQQRSPLTSGQLLDEVY